MSSSFFLESLIKISGLLHQAKWQSTVIIHKERVLSQTAHVSFLSKPSILLTCNYKSGH